MPEIAEVARVVHYLRKSLVGKTLSVVNAPEDVNVFGKVGTTGGEFQKAMTGKKVLDAGQQGKYFWLIMSSPPHPVMHLGMTGWVYVRGEPTSHYRSREKDESEEEWPPEYWKFTLETDSKPKVEAAFRDARRFGRVRLVHCAAKDIKNTTPLKENGPDPVLDKDVLTEEWLEQKMKSKHVPVKALLLNQANISGIGNWVGDEILYHAKLHPEQYSDTFTSEQIKQLHKSLMFVCQTAVDHLADSSKFPDDWLFKHRWGKGKKDAPTTLPNGDPIIHITVGGRTSCVVPSVQKKTGAVAAGVKIIDDEDAGSKNTKRPKANVSKKRKTIKEEVSDDDEDDETIEPKGEDPEAKAPKGRSKKARPAPKVKASKVKPEEAPREGRRRSGRVSKRDN
ncbi:Formamidopyrimidine-DNA glycosylase [Lachnellula suecica]|uniref:Formamidopyrimidine-DNA glycosylase n=1 Tax=Lachnellula suecica TaxID=602035 RepID=A0A8T9C153_9HELO|nr:Formamidopyrimidine-DNA glycosylase [Lachnellula suecica]